MFARAIAGLVFSIPLVAWPTEVIPWGQLVKPENRPTFNTLVHECRTSRLSTDSQCIEVERAKKEFASKRLVNDVDRAQKQSRSIVDDFYRRAGAR